jgi:hypothetical protein
MNEVNIDLVSYSRKPEPAVAVMAQLRAVPVRIVMLKR